MINRNSNNIRIKPAALLLILMLYTVNTAFTNAQTGNTIEAKLDPAVQKTTNTKYQLLPEGFKISGLTAKLIKLPDDTTWYLAFEEAQKYDYAKSNRILSGATNPANAIGDQATESYALCPDPFGRPIEILPCQWLSTMTKEVANQVDMSVDFRVWGEITTYQNINYILPTMVAQPPLFANIKPTQTLPSSRLQTILGSQATQTQTQAIKDTTDKAVLPNNLQQALQSLKEYKKNQTESNYQQVPSQVSTKIDTKNRLVKTNTAELTKWKEGQMILNRLGRIRYETEAEHWLFHFEADSQDLAEPPVILHPCQLLEIAEEIDSQTASMTTFRLSGQIYIYQNRNYLRSRMVMKVYNSTNIIK